MNKCALILSIIFIAGIGLFFYKTQSVQLASNQTALFGGVSLKLEYALTEADREKGLGGRVSIPNDYGMLFVFPIADRYGFWMKDTLVPLDIFWFNNKGQVVSIASEVATSSYPHVFYPTDSAWYVLETSAGFAKTHHITIGSSLELKNFPSVSK